VARRLWKKPRDRDRRRVQAVRFSRRESVSIMALSRYQLRASIAVSDIHQAVAFYEGKLGLQALRSGPSAHSADGSRVYGSGGEPALNV
jgi:hypothetical protein